jgi:hypothetical protein
MSKTTLLVMSLTLLLVMGTPVHAQDISSNVSAQIISAKPGMVNYVEGGPLVFRGDEEEGTKLVARNQLKPGERLQTREGDKAEILLSPGSYLRVAANTQLEIKSAEFDNMHFDLIQGTAILESAAFDKKVHALKISTPAGDVKVVEKGLYRFQITPEKQVEVLVYSGKAEWVKDQSEIATLKASKRYLLGTDDKGKPQFVKLSKDDMDSLDVWSKKRAEYLVAANDRLSDWMFGSSYYGYGYGYRGGWVYNPFFNAFTFAPFGDYGFYSPYGFSYGYYYPYYGYYGHGSSGGGGGSSSSGGTSSASSSKPKNSTAQQRSSSSHSSSAPRATMSSGRSDQGSRSSAHSSSSSSSSGHR